jgi:hypothetical protein
MVISRMMANSPVMQFPDVSNTAKKMARQVLAWMDAPDTKLKSLLTGIVRAMILWSKVIDTVVHSM